jgi:RNA polymerase sigma-70 factor (ECF subfamily)
MADETAVAQAFEEHRQHLTGVAYRMLGSNAEAEDAVQEAWLRLARSDDEEIGNLGGWLTTVVARVSLDMLRSRKSRGEEPLETHLPDPIVTPDLEAGPEQEALLADSVGLALLVVLETLEPAERLAFVLHDMFSVPFSEIGRIVDRSPDAARQLASRARRRVRGAEPEPDADPAAQREVVEAFYSAARDGDFDALFRLLDPEVVLRADGGTRRRKLTKELHGADEVLAEARTFQHLAGSARRANVNGEPGFVVSAGGQPFSVLGLVVRGGRIVEINILADPERIDALDLSFLDD